MQNSKKNYSFLLTHTTKSKIYIRRIEIPKEIVHSGFAVFIFALVIVSIGVFSFTGFDVMAKNETSAPNLVAHQAVSQQLSIEPRSLSYNRPQSSDEFTANSGGPDSDLQLTGRVIDDSESADIEKRLRAISIAAAPEKLPTIWAHIGKINNEFGFRRNPFGGRSYEFHAGMDIDGERGDPVVAPGGGVIIKAGWQGGYGNLIEIDHGNGITTRFGHLAKIDVEVGQNVSRGDSIGAVGSTGRSTGPHLHYELRLDDKPINPRFFLQAEPTEIRQG